MKGILDRSQAADERRREERIAKIEAWEKFQSGEEFTAREIADLICKCTSENAPRGNCGCPSRARDLLDYMPNVQKRATTKHTLYSKTPVKMSTVDWRVNKNIYREIENEARGY